MQKIISGIQQVGVSVPNVHKAFKWYRENFGMDIRIFEETGPAETMLRLTNGQLQKRHVILTLNMQGGGGIEIWQNTGRISELPKFEVKIGDYGIYAVKMKCKDVNAAYDLFKSKGLAMVGELSVDPNGNKSFFLKDIYHNLFQIVKNDHWFKNEGRLTGGVAGCIIGVSNVEKAKEVYSDILGYDQVIYDEEGSFEDFAALPGGEHKMRRMLLRHSQPRKGGFSRFFGPSEIELIKVYDYHSRKIFESRLWGDLGFIHLCFDVKGMKMLKEECKVKKFPFILDSMEILDGSFEIGDAAGHFSYIEDSDGTLIEFAEAYKIPIIKKLGWYLNLKNRNPEKHLPDWLLRALSFSRVKQ